MDNKTGKQDLSDFSAGKLKQAVDSSLGEPLSDDQIEPYLHHYQIDFRSSRVNQQLQQITLSQHRIAVHQLTTESPQGEILVVHGFLDHQGLYNHLLAYLLSQQLKVITFDLPGHGLSSGKAASIDSFDDYQTVIHELIEVLRLGQQGLPLHLLGQSTGCAVINQYLLENSPVIQGRIIELAPLVRPVKWWKITLLHRLFHRLIPSVPRHFKNNSHDNDFINFVMEKDPLQSIAITTEWLGALKHWQTTFQQLPSSQQYQPLIIQGSEDETVDWRYNIGQLKKKFPQANVITLTGAYHHLARESAFYREQIYQWLNQEFAKTTTHSCDSQKKQTG